MQLQTTRAITCTQNHNNIYKSKPPSPPSPPTPLLLPLSSLGHPSKPSSPRLHIGASRPSRHVLSFIISPPHERYIFTLPIPTVVDANDTTNLPSNLHPLFIPHHVVSIRRTSPTDTSHRCVVYRYIVRRIPALHRYVVIVYRHTSLLRRLPCVTLRRLRY